MALLMNPCASKEVVAFTDSQESQQAVESSPPQEENVSSSPSSPPPPPSTANPTYWLTVEPTVNPTLWPTQATMAPSRATIPPTLTPTPETPAPVTQEPTTAATFAPTDIPTTMPTIIQTITLTVSTLAPTSSAPTNQPPTPTWPALTTPPTSPVVNTSLEPFLFTLDISDAQVATGSEDPEDITTQVESILTDFLFAKLSDGDFGDGVTLNSVHLDVTPQIRRAVRVSNIFARQNRRVRFLQVQKLNFDVKGMATFELARGSDVSEQTLTKEANAATKEALEDPDNQEALVQEFQASDSEVLSQTVGISEQFQEENEMGLGSKPTTVSQIFGFLLVGIGVVGLAIYGYVFIKKRRKRALQRKRERNGQYEGYGDAVNSTQSTLSANRSPRSSSSKVIVLPPTDESWESSSASYEGIASESSGSQSDFTRELQLAASRDRMAWIDMERQREVRYSIILSLKKIYARICLTRCIFAVDRPRSEIVAGLGIQSRIRLTIRSWLGTKGLRLEICLQGENKL